MVEDRQYELLQRLRSFAVSRTISTGTLQARRLTDYIQLRKIGEVSAAEHLNGEGSLLRRQHTEPFSQVVTPRNGFDSSFGPTTGGGRAQRAAAVRKRLRAFGG